jgi:hypothetical protein
LGMQKLASSPMSCLPRNAHAQLGSDIVGLALWDPGPRLVGPVLPTFCSEVVWGPKNFPPGSRNRRHVRSSRHVLIERKAKSNAGGLHLLLIIMWPDATPTVLLLQLLLNQLLLAPRSFCVEVESKLMLASRFDFPSASFPSTNAKAPLLNALSMPESLQGHRTMLPH